MDDAVTAWDWLGASGINSEQTLVAGDSAGGGLGVALLLALQEQSKAMPAGAVLFSP